MTNYIIGVGGLNAANARITGHDTTRTDLLATVSVAWANLDPDGIDLILTGIAARGRRT